MGNHSRKVSTVLCRSDTLVPSHITILITAIISMSSSPRSPRPRMGSRPWEQRSPENLATKRVSTVWPTDNNRDVEEKSSETKQYLTISATESCSLEPWQELISHYDTTGRDLSKQALCLFDI